MLKLIFSPVAQRDLNETAAYIANQLHNPSAAVNLIQRIKKDTYTLCEFPELGTPLNAEGSRVAYRYIICGNYMVFYFVAEAAVHIDRILYARRDYLALLFGDLTDIDDTET